MTSYRTIEPILQSSMSYQPNVLEMHARLCMILNILSWFILDIKSPSAHMFYMIYSVCLYNTYQYVCLSYTYSLYVLFPTVWFSSLNSFHTSMNRKPQYSSYDCWDHRICITWMPPSMPASTPLSDVLSRAPTSSPGTLRTGTTLPWGGVSHLPPRPTVPLATCLKQSASIW